MLAALRAGNVVVMVQPPRGFGENPIAIYHDPDLPPTHHYLAAYRWLARRASARTPSSTSASTATWSGCPARPSGMSASCGTDAALGDLPLIYPFLVNDPGEGTQAKRRAHATIVDHLVPPMARAETYGDIARLEQLLDEHATIAAMDPAKLPAIRGADLDADPGRQARPRPGPGRPAATTTSSTSSSCTSTAGCARSRTSQIRDGLHVLGRGADGRGPGRPGAGDAAGPADVGRHVAALPGLREALGLTEDGAAGRVGRRGRGAGPRAGRGDGGGAGWDRRSVDVVAMSRR